MNLLSHYPGKKYHITVDFTLTLAAMIAMGKYGWISRGIEKIFSVSGIGKLNVVAEIVCLYQKLSSDEVVKALAEQGFRPATFAELLAFGAQYPGLQKEFSIIALGTVALDDNEEQITFLRWEENQRDLAYEERNGLPWDPGARFLAVPLEKKG